MRGGGSPGLSASLRAPRALSARSEGFAPRGPRKLRAVVEVGAKDRVWKDRPEGQYPAKAVRRVRRHAP